MFRAGVSGSPTRVGVNMNHVQRGNSKIVYSWAYEPKRFDPLAKDTSFLCPLLIALHKQAIQHQDALVITFDVCGVVPTEKMQSLKTLFEKNSDLIPQPITLQLVDNSGTIVKIPGSGQPDPQFNDEKARFLLQLAMPNSSSSDSRMYTPVQTINIAEVLLNNPTKLAEFKESRKAQAEPR